MPDFPLPGGENLCIDGEHACFFTSNNGINGEKIPSSYTNSNKFKKMVRKSKRVLYIIQLHQGKQEALNECPADENEKGIFLRNNIRNIQASILTGSNLLKTLRDDGINCLWNRKNQLQVLFFREVLFPTKNISFNGDPLSFGGFGIIKLYNTGQTLDTSIVDIVNR